MRFVQFDLQAITEKLADMDGDEDVPKIKLGDASCAAPFTSKLGHVAASMLFVGLCVSSSCADRSVFQSRTSFVKVAALSSPLSRCIRSLL